MHIPQRGPFHVYFILSPPYLDTAKNIQNVTRCIKSSAMQKPNNYKPFPGSRLHTQSVTGWYSGHYQASQSQEQRFIFPSSYPVTQLSPLVLIFSPFIRRIMILTITTGADKAVSLPPTLCLFTTSLGN